MTALWDGLFAPLFGLWLRSLRVSVVGRRRVAALARDDTRFVYALRHSDMVLLMQSHRADSCVVLVSQSEDGSRLDRLLRGLGYGTVRGSSSRGGVGGLLKLRSELRDGSVPTIAVDGPRGPAGTVAPGALVLARSTGAWVVPVAAAARQEGRLRSWDRTRIPWPGTRAFVVYGRPMQVNIGDDLELASGALGRRLAAATITAERLAG